MALKPVFVHALVNGQRVIFGSSLHFYLALAREKVAIVVVVLLWWIFPVTKGGHDVEWCCGVVRQRQTKIKEYNMPIF